MVLKTSLLQPCWPTSTLWSIIFHNTLDIASHAAPMKTILSLLLPGISGSVSDNAISIGPYWSFSLRSGGCPEIFICMPFLELELVMSKCHSALMLHCASRQQGGGPDELIILDSETSTNSFWISRIGRKSMDPPL